jgi:hypothetical protein
MLTEGWERVAQAAGFHPSMFFRATRKVAELYAAARPERLATRPESAQVPRASSAICSNAASGFKGSPLPSSSA